MTKKKKSKKADNHAAKSPEIDAAPESSKPDDESTASPDVGAGDVSDQAAPESDTVEGDDPKENAGTGDSDPNDAGAVAGPDGGADQNDGAAPVDTTGIPGDIAEIAGSSLDTTAEVETHIEKLETFVDDDVLEGSDIQPATFTLSDNSILTLGDVVRLAFVASKLATHKEWNSLMQAEREEIIQATVETLDLPDPNKKDATDEEDDGENAAEAAPPKPVYSGDPIEDLLLLADILEQKGIEVVVEDVVVYNVTFIRKVGDETRQFSKKISSDATPEVLGKVYMQVIEELQIEG